MDMSTKININDYNKFLIQFKGGAFGSQRLGQAFFNTFLTNERDGAQPELFYADTKKAETLIWDNWIDMGFNK